MKNLTDFRKTVENGMDPRLIAQENVNTVLTSRFFAVRDEFTSFNHFLDCLDLENIYKHAGLKFFCLSKLAF